MSNNTEKYNYDFDFSNKTSSLISESIGKPKEFIDDLNNKTTDFLKLLQKEVDESNPTKGFMKKFSKIERGKHPGTFKENIEEYLNSQESKSNNFFDMSNLVKSITEKFSPEELAVMCADNYKKVLFEMSARVVVKDILYIATEVNMDEEQKKKYVNFMGNLMKLDVEDASDLFSNKGFIYFILNSIL